MIDHRNPLDYTNHRNLRNSLKEECNGMCERCDKREICSFSRAPKLKASGYKDSGDERFNARILDASQFRTRYGNRHSQEGFSNPSRQDYNGRNYSSGDYRKALGISDTSGFRGSYSGGSQYSKMTPKAGKSSYCSGGCSK